MPFTRNEWVKKFTYLHFHPDYVPVLVRVVPDHIDADGTDTARFLTDLKAARLKEFGPLGVLEINADVIGAAMETLFQGNDYKIARLRDSLVQRYAILKKEENDRYRAAQAAKYGVPEAMLDKVTSPAGNWKKFMTAAEKAQLWGARLGLSAVGLYGAYKTFEGLKDTFDRFAFQLTDLSPRSVDILTQTNGLRVLFGSAAAVGAVVIQRKLVSEPLRSKVLRTLPERKAAAHKAGRPI